jgi:polyisoprenoid-binding protein YceI
MGSRAEGTLGAPSGTRRLAYLIALLAIHQALPSTELSAQVRGPVPEGQVTSGTLSFDGRATVGDFTGKTQSVAGQFTGAADLGGVRGWVEAPVESLKTGDGKRDKDLNKSMESGKYPKLRFDLSGVTPGKASKDGMAVTLHGLLHIHGVTRRVDLPGTIRFQNENAHVRSDFPLNLKDYRIGGLSKLLGVLKKNENIDVHVDLLFRLARAS